MTVVHRGFHHETDVLIRRVDAQLARLRAARPPHDVDLAERLVASLRQLILATTHASAADRARVRAAVHYFVLRKAGRRSIRPLVADLLVVNDVAQRLNRPDLCVGPVGLGGTAVPANSPPPGTQPMAPPAGDRSGGHSPLSDPPDKLAG
jgi:hypothetical protein